MRIGIVTTWYERGAAYVSRIYMNLLKEEGHEVYIYARGGGRHESQFAKEWNESYVTRNKKFTGFKIDLKQYNKWLKINNIESVLFNEQQDFYILVWMKKHYPNIKIGAYVDYYTENTIPLFRIYDFLICNTHRHMQAMEFHPQKFYIEWGTDIDKYKPGDKAYDNHEKIRFFHSAGMSTRKGTDILVNSYINSNLKSNSELILHTQLPCKQICGYEKEELEKNGITVIERTVTPPGLYFMGDVYVYPTRLDGLGLTMYEALACGMPLITSDFPPMNEVGNDEIVKRVKIKDYYCRGDAYYFPMCICDSESLEEQMCWFVDHKEELNKIKKLARQYAEEHYDIKKRAKQVSEIFVKSTLLPIDKEVVEKIDKTFNRTIGKRVINRVIRLLKVNGGKI